MSLTGDANAVGRSAEDSASKWASGNSKVIGIIGWVLIGAFVAALAVLVDYRVRVRVFQVAWLVGFIGYGLLIWRQHGDTFRKSATARRPPYAWLIGFVLLRLALLGAAPSDDLYRYMWEGKVQRYGFNPYTTSPEDPSLAELARDDPNWPHINHRDYPTIYPPLAQFAFRAASYLGDSTYIAKIGFALLDVAVVLLLWLALERCGVSPEWTLVYAACPLTLTAVAADGHLDSLMLAFIAAGIWAAGGNRWNVLGGCVGLAIASKLVAVVLLPWLAVRHWRSALIAVVVVAITYLPFAGAGLRILEGLTRFTGTTSVFGPIHGPVEWMVGAVWSRRICAAALAAVLVALTFRRRRFEHYARSAIIALMLLMPILHYWYLTWLLLVVTARVRWWQVTLCAGYVFYFEAERQRYLTGEWSMPVWASICAFVPAAVVMAIEYAAIPRDASNMRHLESYDPVARRNDGRGSGVDDLLGERHR